MAYPDDFTSFNTYTGTAQTLNQFDHGPEHNKIGSAVAAIEQKLGLDSSADQSSHDYKLGEVTGSDKAVGKSAIQTLTNKTFSDPTIFTLGSDATGDIYYRSGDGSLERLAIGTAGTFLTTSGGLPSWGTAPSGGSTDGWISFSTAITRTGTASFTVSGDCTAIFQKGTKVKYNDGAQDYGVVSTSSLSSGTTTVNLIPNTDYSMANVSITGVYYSYSDVPQGYPDWFNYSISPTWNGNAPAGTVTNYAKFSVKGKTCFVFAKQNNTTAGTNNTQVVISGPVAANVPGGEYSIPANGLVSTATIDTVPTTSTRAVGYGTNPDIYLFFSSISAKSFEVSIFYPI